MDTMTDWSVIRPSTSLRPLRWLSGVETSVETSNVKPFIFVHPLSYGQETVGLYLSW